MSHGDNQSRRTTIEQRTKITEETLGLLSFQNRRESIMRNHWYVDFKTKFKPHLSEPKTL